MVAAAASAAAAAETSIVIVTVIVTAVAADYYAAGRLSAGIVRYALARSANCLYFRRCSDYLWPYLAVAAAVCRRRTWAGLADLASSGAVVAVVLHAGSRVAFGFDSDWISVCS